MKSTGSDFRQKQYEFAAHLRDPDKNPAPADVEDRRMQIYRDLFFNNIVGFLANSYPILSAQLGEAGWKSLVRDFFRDHTSHSPLFPQVAREFLTYLGDERADDAQIDGQPDPEFIYDLAHYEWLETELKLAADPEAPEHLNTNGDLLGEQPVLSPMALAASYRWAVGDFTKEERPDAPAEQPEHYLIFRDTNDRVQYKRLNLVSARLFQLLDEATHTGRDALLQIAQELNHPQPEKVLEGGQQILEKWRELGVVLGTRPTKESS